MRNIKLIISYNGSKFIGWQKQNQGLSIQGFLEDALSSLLNENINLIASGRTDSGVHAIGQIASFKTFNENIPAQRFCYILNNFINNKDLVIIDSSEVNIDFHPRFDAVKRYYRYRIVTNRFLYPWEIGFFWNFRLNFNLNELNELARLLIGVHNFSSLCAKNDPNKNKTREIFESKFEYNNGVLEYVICGNAFLWKMVRGIVGNLITIHYNNENKEKLIEILKKQDRSAAYRNAPSCGLYLEKVEYL